MRKKSASLILLLLLLVITVLLPLTGCSTAKNKETARNAKKLRIDFVAPMVGHPVWLAAKDGMDAAAEEFGFSGVWMGADDHSLAKTVEALEQAIAEKPDAIVSYPFVPASFSKTLQKAKDAGIPVVFVTADMEDKTLRRAFIGTNCEEWGRKHAEALYKKAGDPFNVGVIMSNLDAENQVIAVNQLKKFVSGIPGARIVDIQEDMGNSAKASEVLAAMLKAHPEMNALFGTEGGGAVGFAKVLDEMHLTDKVTVISMDDTEPNLSMVREGKIYGIMAQNFYKMGYLGAKYAWEAAQGKEVPSETDSGVTLVTKENLDTYKENR